METTRLLAVLFLICEASGFAQTPVLVYEGEISRALAWFPNDDILAMGGDFPSIKVCDIMIWARWDLDTKGKVSSLEWKPDGEEIAYGSGGTIGLINLKGVNRDFAVTEEDMWNIAWSPDGAQIASGSGIGDKRSFRLWNITTGNVLHRWDTTYMGYGCTNKRVKWAPDGSRLYTSASCGFYACIYDPLDGKQIGIIGNLGDDVTVTSGIASMAISPDGEKLLMGDHNELIVLIDAKTGKPIRKMHSGAIGTSNIVAWHPNNAGVCASGSANGKVVIWDSNTGFALNVIQAHKGAITSLAWNFNGTWLATAGEDGQVLIWHASNFKITGVEKDVSQETMRAFPNPAKDHVQVAFGISTPEPLLLTISDQLGNVVKTESITATEASPHRFMISVDELPSGFYTLSLRNTRRILQNTKIEVVH